MGAQTDDRLTQYKKRYKDWEDPNGKTPESNPQTWDNNIFIYINKIKCMNERNWKIWKGHANLLTTIPKAITH